MEKSEIRELVFTIFACFTVNLHHVNELSDWFVVPAIVIFGDSWLAFFWWFLGQNIPCWPRLVKKTRYSWHWECFRLGDYIVCHLSCLEMHFGGILYSILFGYFLFFGCFVQHISPLCSWPSQFFFISLVGAFFVCVFFYLFS